MKRYLAKARIARHLVYGNEKGGMNIALGIILGIIGLVVLAKVLVAMWPTLQTTATDIAGLTQTDAGTETLQAIWPVVIIVVGVGAAIVAIVMVVKRVRG